MKVLTGELVVGERRFGVVCARFNQFVTDLLLEGALGSLRKMGAAEPDITVVWVPGAFEIPAAARGMARTGAYAGIICLGAVIRGDTAHFEYVAGECARGVASVTQETGVPVSLGVLTTENREQALDRAGGRLGNKGAEAAEVAVEMADLLARLAAGPGN